MTLPALSKYQGFEVVRIARSQILDAPYNPRRISAGNKERLAKGLSRHKLVMPPVWNRTTGNLVSGHQRLAILDDKHRGTDYSLDVAAIDVPEAEEVQINILLNNESAMGEFDNQAVKVLSEEFAFDLSDAGFSREDLYIDFEWDKPLPAEKTAEEKQAVKERRDIEKQEYREETRSGTSQDGAEVRRDYSLQIVFPTNQQAADFLRSKGLDPTKRYFPADLFLESLGL